jgi:hypothetical protein
VEVAALVPTTTLASVKVDAPQLPRIAVVITITISVSVTILTITVHRAVTVTVTVSVSLTWAFSFARGWARHGGITRLLLPATAVTRKIDVDRHAAERLAVLLLHGCFGRDGVVKLHKPKRRVHRNLDHCAMLCKDLPRHGGVWMSDV